jgi:Fic family protein
VLVATPNLTNAQILKLEDIWLLQQEIAPSLNEPKIWTGTLRRQALARVVRSSTGIEGFIASSSSVNSVLLNSDSAELSEKTAAAISGYRDAMTFVLKVAGEPGFKIEQNFLSALHFMILKRQGTNDLGGLRRKEIFVVDERSGLEVHRGADSSELPKLMAELVDRFSPRSERIAIIDSAMAHLNLVLIHPFADGNGRLARVLQSALLASEEKPSPLFLSVEEYLGMNTDAYYRVLAEVGGGVWNPRVDASPWIDFMLTAHLAQLRSVKKHAQDLTRKWVLIAKLVADLEINERCVPALVHAASQNRLTNAIYRKLLSESGDEISLLTASRDLAQLVEKQLLEANGENNARTYSFGLAISGFLNHPDS